MDRYEVPGGHESQFEPGSNQLVLRNRLGINSEKDMEVAETRALALAMEKSYREIEQDQQLTVAVIRGLHYHWLYDIYDFAGEYRKVNMSKGDAFFCPAIHIQDQMNLFEQEQLSQFTPCAGLDLGPLCENIATVHAELVLIHPFREGNGRLARWVSNVMVAQAGFATMTYDNLKSETAVRDRYFRAVKKGFDRDTDDLSQLFEEWIQSSSNDLEDPSRQP